MKKHIVTENHIIREGTGLVLVLITIPVFRAYGKREEALLTAYAEMLTAGAGKYTRAQFADALARLGTSLTVSSGDGSLLVKLQTTEETLQKSLTLLTAMLRAPRFEARELVRMKRHAKNALPTMREDARARAYQVFANRLIEKTDIRRSTEPEALVSELKNVSVARLKKLHADTLQHRFVWTAGGSADSVAKVTRCLKKLSGSGTVLPVYVPVARPKKREVFLLDIPHKQNIEFTLGGPLPMTAENPEYAAFVFGMSVLALQGGFSGRLMSTVREKEGLTYSIYGKAEEVMQSAEGFWRIMTFFNPKDAVAGITATLREVERMRARGITKDELKRFKAILKTRSVLKEDSLIAKVAELHGLKDIGLTQEMYDAFQRDILGMTIGRVNSAVRTYLNTKHLIMSGAGPVVSLRKELLAFAEPPRTKKAGGDPALRSGRCRRVRRAGGA